MSRYAAQSDADRRWLAQQDPQDQVEPTVRVLVGAARSASGASGADSYALTRTTRGQRVWWSCACPAHKYRRGPCKHVQGLAQAVRLGYEPDPQVYSWTAEGRALLDQALAARPRPVMPVWLAKAPANRGRP